MANIVDYHLGEDKNLRNLAKKVLICSLVIHLICAVFSLGFHQFDEHFQIMEFARYKLGFAPAKDLAWEYHNQMRPWLQPAILVFLIKTLNIFSIKDPFFTATLFRIFSSLLGWFAGVVLFFNCLKWFKDTWERKIALVGINLLWFIPYIHARGSAENQGASFFILAMGLVLLFIKPDVKRSAIPHFISIVSGLLLALSFHSRFQLGISILALIIWLIWFGRLHWKSWFIFCQSAFICMIMLHYIDFWGYGEKTIPAWNYLKQNIFEGKVGHFGNSPWYDYFRKMIFRGIPPISLPLVLAGFYTFWKFPKHILTWVCLPFIIIHSMIGHKELRFLFPIIVMSPVFLCFYSLHYREKLRNLWEKLWLKRSLIVLNTILLIIICFKPANSSIKFYKEIYYNQPRLQKLFGYASNPYNMVTLNISYYKRSPFSVFKIQKLDVFWDHLNKQKDSLFLFTDNGNRFDEVQSSGKCKLAYSSIPDFLLGFMKKAFKRKKHRALFICKPT